MPRGAVILVEHRDTKYSINALVASLDAARVADVMVSRWLSEALSTLTGIVERYERIVVGVSLMTEHFVTEFSAIREFVSKARRVAGEKLLLVAGGPHATGDPLGTLRTGFDAVVVGEGEVTLPLLVEAWFEEGWDGVTRVKGVAFLEEDRLVYTGHRPRINLDEYWSFPWWRRRFSPIEITRGCHWGCRYCETWFIHGGRERHRSIESILEHVRIMLKHGLRDIRFITPNALGYGERVRGERCLDLVGDLLETIHRVGSREGARIFFGSFPSEVRPEYVDDEAARLLKRYVANKRVIIGAQSGSERILKLLNRGHTPEDVLNAVHVLVRHGFRPEVDFIFGLPGETREDIEASLNLMKQIVKLGGRVHAHTFMPLPGTPLESAPGGRIPQWLRREIHRLIGFGGLYGQWEKQEKLAQLIHDFYRKGLIQGLRGWSNAILRPGSM
ncbi:Radical SAM domain protein [Pyrolobus fumarii 1A]|uniref:Radical SAM domain protein n=1 Tax=Pyrolobus fumarii (strain DSM 11204 / 1A) TaxID=694429 RepID=G0EDG8_PYRF1|nr:TIGR04013 family B12-binding domain/radical SAM domain-containing protein [Pyrolobus fumarii]AEM38653.1 Radical SAM domain protein [Pyrolobus fumarii 1A]